MAKRKNQPKARAKPAPKRKRRHVRRKPVDQAIPPGASPISGTFPPVEHQFPPGVSGNPAGRPTAGATIREHYNALMASDLTQAQLRRIATDPRSSIARAAAARDVLRALEYGDLADFEPIADGKMSLEQARKKGLNTAAIRKIKVKRRTLRDAEGQEIGEEVEREVELYDRAGDHLSRICDQTESRPKTNIHHTTGDPARPEPIVLMHTAPPPAPPAGKGA